MRTAQPFAQSLVAFEHGDLEAGDGALGKPGGLHQFRDGGLERGFVGLQPLDLPVQQRAVNDSEREQKRDHALDDNAEWVAHVASMRLVDSSAFSNIAKVVFGLRSCFVTRTATRSPTRPMRPSVS